jgi:hypothetical protein
VREGGEEQLLFKPEGSNSSNRVVLPPNHNGRRREGFQGQRMECEVEDPTGDRVAHEESEAELGLASFTTRMAYPSAVPICEL